MGVLVNSTVVVVAAYICIICMWGGMPVTQLVIVYKFVVTSGRCGSALGDSLEKSC